MSEWLDFNIRLEGNSVFLVLLPVVFGLTYYVYQRTHPSIDQVLRLGLVVVRSLAMGLLLMTLAEPVLGLWSKEVVRPLVLILVDTSSSMSTEEDGIQRLTQVGDVLGHADFRKALSQAEVEVYGFAEEPYVLSLDTLSIARPAGQATDLAGALQKSLKRLSDRKNLETVLLLSDGAHNLGEDPARVAGEAGAPVYTLGVGSEENPADIQIVQAKAVETGYVGQSLQVHAELRSWGYAGRSVDVLLYEGNQQIGRQRLSLQNDALVQRVKFKVVPTATGPHIYRLVVPPVEGEFSRDNNEALVFIRVLEERTQVLLVAGGPSPDLAFLQRSLAADSNIVVQAVVQKKTGEFNQGSLFNQEDLPDKDVVILLDPGIALMAGREGQAIKKRIHAGTGLLFIGGSRTFQNWDPRTPVAEILPVAVERPGARFVAREVPLRLSREGRHHPVVRLQEEEAGVGVDPWMQLPPLSGYLPITRKRQGTLVLVEGLNEEHAPIILTGSYGQGKVIAALSAAFWRLDLLSSGVGERPQTIRDFWRNAIKWLAIQTPAGRVRVSTERHIYRAGEEVVFAAQVFDELLRPQSAATVQIELDKEELKFQLQDQDGGRYRGTWTGLGPGDYHYASRAYAGDILIGADEGHFIIEQHSIESVDVRANKVLLGEMAHASGGRYRALEDWREMLELLAWQKRLVEGAKVYSLWGQQWLLGVVILLLAFEWIARKRRGMI